MKNKLQTTKDVLGFILQDVRQLTTGNLSHHKARLINNITRLQEILNENPNAFANVSPTVCDHKNTTDLHTRNGYITMCDDCGDYVSKIRT